MDKTQAIYNFWSNFTWPAYDETAVPDKTPTPYITYNVVLDGFDHPVAMTASLWYKSTSWVDITLKCDEIQSALANGGKKIAYENGQLWIKPGNPFAQHMSDTDTSIRRIVLNIEVEYQGE